METGAKRALEQIPDTDGDEPSEKEFRYLENRLNTQDLGRFLDLFKKKSQAKKLADLNFKNIRDYMSLEELTELDDLKKKHSKDK